MIPEGAGGAGPRICVFIGNIAQEQVSKKFSAGTVQW